MDHKWDGIQDTPAGRIATLLAPEEDEGPGIVAVLFALFPLILLLWGIAIVIGCS